MRTINIELEISRIKDFIRSYTNTSGFENLILGLSGGIDSALSAVLAVEALGKDKVIGILMPSSDSHPDSENDARILAEQLGIKHEVHSIKHMVEEHFSLHQPDADKLRIGNWKARCRMMILYDLSAKYRALVVGTSNRTELLVGYFTQFGDGACAFEPIAHLYKTEVRLLAEYLNVPKRILSKAPTADLWNGQTDEAELGITYPVLDEILFQLTEENIDIHASQELKFPLERYEYVLSMIKNTEYKRHTPPVLD